MGLLDVITTLGVVGIFIGMVGMLWHWKEVEYLLQNYDVTVYMLLLIASLTIVLATILLEIIAVGGDGAWLTLKLLE